MHPLPIMTEYLFKVQPVFLTATISSTFSEDNFMYWSRACFCTTLT